MKKAKLLMAVACLLFFAALVYTNLPTEEDKEEKAINYTRNMEEIKEINTK